MKRLYSQTTFNGGEISPFVYSRIDVNKYDNFVATATNVRVIGHGPIQRRNGTKYIDEVKTSAKATRLISFQFNADTSYILEFGENYIRFYKDGALIKVTGTPIEITTTYSESELFELSYEQIDDTLYICHEDHPPAQLVRESDTSWTYGDITFLPPPTYEPGVFPNTTLTPAATTGTSINFTAGAASFQDGDIGRQLVHLAGTGRASIISVTSSTVVVCDIVEDFPSTSAIAADDWKMDLSPICDLTPSGTKVGSIIEISADYGGGLLGDKFTITGITKASPGVVTVSADPGLSDGDMVVVKDVEGMTQLNGKEYTIENMSGGAPWTFDLKGENTSGYTTYASGGTIQKILRDDSIAAFASGDVGNYILMSGGVCQITAYNNDDSVQAEVLKSLNSLDETGNWTMEEETWDATRGYPRIVGNVEQRLVFASTNAQPRTIWMSETGILDGFGVGPEDNDGIELDLRSNKNSQIAWLEAGRNFVVGTTVNEVTITGGNNSAAITPSAAQQTPRTSYGSSVQKPIVIGDQVLFVQRSGRKIRTFRYDFQSDGFVAEDLTFLAEHMTEDGIKEMAYAQEPYNQIYVVLDSGDMMVGTYVIDQNVIGWCRYTTDGSYESVTTITNGAVDEVYVVVNRTINGSTVRYVEKFDTEDGTDRLDGYSDSYLTYSSFTGVSGITQADPGVVTTSSAHGLSNGDDIKLIDVGGMTEVNNTTYIVANKTSTTFELTDSDGNNIDTTGFTAYTSGGECHALVNTISGLDHLEGETVEIKSDGARTSSATVSSGSITLPSSAYEVVVGIPYTSTITTLPLNYKLGIGPIKGQNARLIRPLLEVYKSVMPTVNGQTIPSRSPADLMDTAVPLYSGIIEAEHNEWSVDGTLTFTIDGPFPFTLTGIFGTIEVGVR